MRKSRRSKIEDLLREPDIPLARCNDQIDLIMGGSYGAFVTFKAMIDTLMNELFTEVARGALVTTVLRQISAEIKWLAENPALLKAVVGYYRGSGVLLPLGIALKVLAFTLGPVAFLMKAVAVAAILQSQGLLLSTIATWLNVKAHAALHVAKLLLLAVMSPLVLAHMLLFKTTLATRLGLIGLAGATWLQTAAAKVLFSTTLGVRLGLDWHGRRYVVADVRDGLRGTS